MGLKPREVFVDLRGIHDQQITLLLDTIHDQVVDHAALFVEQKGVLAFADGKPFEIIGQHAVQPFRRRRPGNEELPHVRDVEDAELAPNRLVLVKDAGVLDGHRPAPEADHLSAKRHVFAMQRSLFQGAIGFGRHGEKG